MIDDDTLAFKVDRIIEKLNSFDERLGIKVFSKLGLSIYSKKIKKLKSPSFFRTIKTPMSFKEL